MPSKREYLYGLGLTAAPTGRGRFSREGNAALDKARAEGMTFTDDEVTVKVSTPKAAKPIAMPKAEKHKASDYDPKAVRAWAIANGHEVGERGRIHGDIVDAYFAATDESERESRAGEFDVYRDLAAETYPRDARFTGTYTHDGKEYTMQVGTATACTNCKTSLIICRCSNPTIVSGHGGSFVSVTRI